MIRVRLPERLPGGLSTQATALSVLPARRDESGTGGSAATTRLANPAANSATRAAPAHFILRLRGSIWGTLTRFRGWRHLTDERWFKSIAASGGSYDDRV